MGKCGAGAVSGTGSTSGNSRQTGLMRWPRGLARASFTSLSLNSSLCEMRRRRCLGGGCGCTCGRCASPASSALAATVPRMPSAVIPAARPEVDARFCRRGAVSFPRGMDQLTSYIIAAKLSLFFAFNNYPRS